MNAAISLKNATTPANENRVHPDLTDYGRPYEYRVGSRWNRAHTATPKALRAAILAAIKEEQAAGRVPSAGIKLSVRVKYSGLALSATVRVVQWCESVVNPEHVRRMVEDGWSGGVPRYTPNLEAVLGQLRGTLSTLNYDRSDRLSDYTDVGFFAHVEVDGDLERAERAFYESGCIG